MRDSFEERDIRVRITGEGGSTIGRDYGPLRNFVFWWPVWLNRLSSFLILGGYYLVHLTFVLMWSMELSHAYRSQSESEIPGRSSQYASHWRAYSQLLILHLFDAGPGLVNAWVSTLGNYRSYFFALVFELALLDGLVHSLFYGCAQRIPRLRRGLPPIHPRQNPPFFGFYLYFLSPWLNIAYFFNKVPRYRIFKMANHQTNRDDQEKNFLEKVSLAALLAAFLSLHILRQMLRLYFFRVGQWVNFWSKLVFGVLLILLVDYCFLRASFVGRIYNFNYLLGILVVILGVLGFPRVLKSFQKKSRQFSKRNWGRKL